MSTNAALATADPRVPAEFEEDSLKEFWRELVRFSVDARLKLDGHELLPAWYVYSQLTDEDAKSARVSITEQPEGGVDAIHIETGKRVVLVQSKLHASLSA